MKKIIITMSIVLMAIVAANAQTNEESTATQSTKLVMSNAIEITFNSTGSTEGSDVTLAFNNVNDYANGVESAPIEIRVRSNKKFHVWYKANSNRFTYTGTTTPAPSMNVNKLAVKVVNNNTGGRIPDNVDNVYKNVTQNDKNLVRNGEAGGNNTFSIQYKADPGYEFPAGTYTVDVVYTATQL